jgi:hypothetical protein
VRIRLVVDGADGLRVVRFFVGIVGVWAFGWLIYLYVEGVDYFFGYGIMVFVEGYLHTSADP